MTIQIPHLCNSYLETVGCYWHLKGSDVENITNVSGTRVSPANKGDCKAFCRSVVENGRLRNAESNAIRVHLEVAAKRSFSLRTPEVSSTLDEISEQLSGVLRGKQFEISTISCGFRIPAQQIAVGSALSLILGIQGRLHREHQAVLTRGTMSLVSDNNDDAPIDTLTFELNSDDDDAYFSISVNGAGEDSFSLDCLANAALRLTAVFNKLVLAKDDPKNHEDASDE